MKDEGTLQILERHMGDEKNLIAILEEIQKKYSYLPESSLRLVAEQTGHSLVDIYGVATFYRSFSLEPRGKHLVSVCLGTACHVRGSPRILEEFQRQLGISSGQTTSDRQFTLETVNCVGACALGPVVVVDGEYFSNVTNTEVKSIIDRTLEAVARTKIEQDYHIFPVEVSCPYCNHGLMDPDYAIDGYPSIRVTASFERKHGWLRLSSLYGSYNVFSEYDVPMETIVNFFCPHCHAELASANDCPRCGARMVTMIVRGGGVVQICSRRGCREHMLDLSGVNV